MKAPPENGRKAFEAARRERDEAQPIIAELRRRQAENHFGEAVARAFGYNPGKGDDRG